MQYRIRTAETASYRANNTHDAHPSMAQQLKYSGYMYIDFNQSIMHAMHHVLIRTMSTPPAHVPIRRRFADDTRVHAHRAGRANAPRTRRDARAQLQACSLQSFLLHSFTYPCTPALHTALHAAPCMAPRTLWVSTCRAARAPRLTSVARQLSLADGSF